MGIVDIIKTCKENGYTGEQALKIVRSEAKGRSMSKILDEFYERISKDGNSYWRNTRTIRRRIGSVFKTA